MIGLDTRVTVATETGQVVAADAGLAVTTVIAATPARVKVATRRPASPFRIAGNMADPVTKEDMLRYRPGRGGPQAKVANFSEAA
jgi:hypothetical protein